jgi:hypothetical protein
LIVRLPADLLHTDVFTPVLRDYCTLLHTEGAFVGLSWADAKQIAAAVAFDCTQRQDATDFIAIRACNAHRGVDGMAWDDRGAAARALTIAAQVLGL